MTQDGTIKKYSDLARLGQVSAARIAQMMNLLHLAPDIQEQILSPDTPIIGMRESSVRKLSSVVLRDDQRVRSVADESVTKCIFEIRQALDDDAQLLVRTVARRGYLLRGGS